LILKDKIEMTQVTF